MAVRCESGCLCALAPHGAGDCLHPGTTANQLLFSVASGWFRSQNRHCSWRPGAKRAKGGQRWLKPDLGYIPATYFVSASLSMERVKGIEPSCEAWKASVLPLNYTRVQLAHILAHRLALSIGLRIFSPSNEFVARVGRTCDRSRQRF